MAEENSSLHVGYDYEEAVNAKRDILQAQINLLNTIRIVKEFKKARKEEFALKSKLKIVTRRLISELKIVIEDFPLPEQLQLEEEKRQEEEKTKKVKIKEKTKKKLSKEEKDDMDIETELQDISRKLKSLR